jgi:F-type H+-transporting ATPase subunit epsilon
MEHASAPAGAPALRLEVVAPDRKVLETTADEVVLPGKLGYLGVRPGHTPLLTSLGIGEVSFVQGGKTRYLALAEGFAEILPDRVTVLAEAAERCEEIDVERARAARERAEKGMSEIKDASDEAFLRFQVKLARAVSRIAVAAKRQG